MAIYVPGKSRKELEERFISVVQSANRRALREGLEASLTPSAYAWWVEVWDRRCAYCRRELMGVMLEHMVPISRGGASTLSNVVPACGSCNNLKRSRTPEEWLNGEKLEGFQKRLARAHYVYELAELG